MEMSAAAEGGRVRRLENAVGRLKGRGGRLDPERSQLIAGGVLAGLGLLVVLLGWYGAANTPYVFEQIPYMISGGMLGLALVFLGGFVYFAYWVGRLVRESRQRSDEQERALRRIEELLWADLATGNGRASQRSKPRKATTNGGFVATANGTMFHRDDCPVVADREGLRRVGPDARGLEPCRLCDPLDGG
jgi:hypothetical protein